MPTLRIRWMLAAAMTLLLAACVELTGQRISWFHDRVRDELRIILCYDGVHDTAKAEAPASGIEALTEFVANGDVMLVDWPFHWQHEALERHVVSDRTPPAMRELLLLLRPVRVTTLAHYRDSRGRIGAAQHVVIPNVSAVLCAANAAIREEHIQDPWVDAQWPRTARLVDDALRAGHDFLSLDGHAFVIDVPANRNEMRAIRAHAVDGLFEAFLKEGAAAKVGVVCALSSVNVSWIEEQDRVRLVVGDREVPSTFRARQREEYSENLAEPIVRLVPSTLDAFLAPAFGDALGELPTGVGDFVAFGPPEEFALALARTADDSNSKQSPAARARLVAWSAAWNRDGGLPAAPVLAPDAPANAPLLPLWSEWYRRVQEP
ncbi:MAG: hypothetical protein ACKVX7_13480 [Planctomycetota bacterium]